MTDIARPKVWHLSSGRTNIEQKPGRMRCTRQTSAATDRTHHTTHDITCQLMQARFQMGAATIQGTGRGTRFLPCADPTTVHAY
jgi:hypothetical protein